MTINKCSVVIFIDNLYFHLRIDWLQNLNFCFIKIVRTDNGVKESVTSVKHNTRTIIREHQVANENYRWTDDNFRLFSKSPPSHKHLNTHLHIPATLINIGTILKRSPQSALLGYEIVLVKTKRGGSPWSASFRP